MIRFLGAIFTDLYTIHISVKPLNLVRAHMFNSGLNLLIKKTISLFLLVSELSSIILMKGIILNLIAQLDKFLLSLRGTFSPCLILSFI